MFILNKNLEWITKQREVVNNVRSRLSQNESQKRPEFRFPQTFSMSAEWIEIYVKQNKNENLKLLVYCMLNMNYHYAPTRGKMLSPSNAPITEAECPSY